MARVPKAPKRKPAARGKLTQRKRQKLVDDFVRDRKVQEKTARKAARVAQDQPALALAAVTKGDPREAALEAARRGDHDTVLLALLAVWWTEPSAQLADVIAAVSRKAKLAGAVRGNTAAARTAWSTRAAAPQPLDIGPLLDSLADVSSGAALQRLTLVERWHPDPRVDAAIVDLLFAVPYRATSTQPFWKRLFVLAREIVDRRQLARLWSWSGDGVAPTMRAWLRAQINRLLAAHRSAGPETDVTAMQRVPDPILDQLVASLGPKVSVGSRNLDALLQAIYDAPDDDAPRLVYADCLLERSDLRGEFINLQIARSSDREVRKREAELLQLYGKHWLGQLAPIVMAGYEFERGFLADCRIDNKHMDRVRKLVGHRAWSTVRAIEGSAAIALDPVMRSLRSLVFDASTARNHEALPDSWRDLLLGTERPIESLTYTGIEADRQWENALEANQSVRPGVQGRWVHVPQAMEIAALCSCSALPKLRELTVRESPELVATPLLGSEVIRRLHTLRFAFDTQDVTPLQDERNPPLAPFAAALTSAPVPRLAFALGMFHTTIVELERGARGYERLVLGVGPRMASGAVRGAAQKWSRLLVDRSIGVLDAMPPSLRTLAIHATRDTDPQQLARLRAAAVQKGLQVSEAQSA